MSTDKLEKAEKIVGRGNHPFMMLFGPIEHVGNYTIFNRACFTSNMQSLKPNDRVVFKNDNVEYLLVIIAQQLSSNQLWLYVLAPNSSTLFRMRASLIDKVLPPIASQGNCGGCGFLAFRKHGTNEKSNRNLSHGNRRCKSRIYNKAKKARSERH